MSSKSSASILISYHPQVGITKLSACGDPYLAESEPVVSNIRLYDKFDPILLDIVAVLAAIYTLAVLSTDTETV